MSSSQFLPTHTPGPWTIDVTWRGNLTVIGPDLRPICTPARRSEANATLIAAAPDYHDAATCGAQVNLPDFLDWIADRLVHVHGDDPNVDFVVTCRDRARKLRAAIAKATGAAE